MVYVPGRPLPVEAYPVTLLAAGGVLAAASMPLSYVGFEIATGDSISVLSLVTGGILVLVAVMTYLASRLMRRRAQRRSSDLLDDTPAERFGLWLTDDYLMVADENGPQAVRRDDILNLRLRRAGRRKVALLAVELRQGRRCIFAPTSSKVLGWKGRGAANGNRWAPEGVAPLEPARQQEFTDELANEPAVTAADYAANRQFGGFMRCGWTILRGPPYCSRIPLAVPELFELTATALAAWPDEARAVPRPTCGSSPLRMGTAVAAASPAST